MRQRPKRVRTIAEAKRAAAVARDAASGPRRRLGGGEARLADLIWAHVAPRAR